MLKKSYKFADIINKAKENTTLFCMDWDAMGIYFYLDYTTPITHI